MTCPYCNENIADIAQFCPVCGQKQIPPSKKAPQSPATQVPQQPATQIPQPPATQVSQPPATQIPQPPAAQVPQPPAAQVPQQPATQVSQPPAPQIPQSPAPQIPQQPAPQVSQPPATQIPQPPATQVPQPPATQVPQQPATQIPQPPATQVPQPPATQIPQPPATQIPQPPAAQIPQPPVTQIPQPPAPQVPQPPAPQIPQPPATQIPQPPATQVPQPPATQIPEKITPPGAEQPMEDAPLVTNEENLNQFQEMEPLPPVTQAVDDTKSSSKIPLLLGAVVLVLGLAGGAIHYMSNSDTGEFSSADESFETTTSLNPVTTVRQYCHFANRSDITNEVVLSYFSQGTWQEMENNLVHYEGVLNGSQESIVLEYTVDSSSGDSSLLAFSVNDVSLGQDYDSRTAFFTQLFQLACSGIDNGQEEIPSFNLDELLFQLVKTSEVSPGSYLYYDDLADVLYPDSHWAITSLDETSFHVDFEAFEGETMVIFARLLVETQTASVTMAYFSENKTELDLIALAQWADETSERFFGLMEEEPLAPEIPVTPPEIVNLSETEIMARYTEEMARYQNGQKENWSTAEFRSANLPETAAYYTDLNVTFVDLDGNGVPEMIVDNGAEVIVAIHSLSNSSGSYQPTLLIGNTFQSSISIGNEGYIAYTTSTAFDSATTLYQVSGDTLLEVDSHIITTWTENSYEFTSISEYLPAEPEPQEEIEPEPTTETSTNEVVDLLSGNENKYASILSKVAQALSNEADASQLESDNLSLLFQDFTLEEVGFAFLDLNGDGEDELLFGEIQDKSGAFLALYGTVDNSPTLLCNASESNQYILCSDGLIAYLGGDSTEKTFSVTSGSLLESAEIRSFHQLNNAFSPMYNNLSNFIV